MDSLPPEINVITLNVWGLKQISKLRSQRISEIARRIASASPTPHIVALQELFCAADYRELRRLTSEILPHGKFYYAGAFGAGLAILSRWPIEESSMFAYPLNGRPTAFWRGDWYVGKGVACASIRYGPGSRDVVEVFNTHLHARYSSDRENSYDCHRAAQAWELAKLLRAATARGHLALTLGDLNMLPLSLPHRILTTRGPATDAWRSLHPSSSLGPAHYGPEAARRVPVPTAESNLRENGVTSDSVLNTWRWTPEQRRLAARSPGAAVVPPNAVDKPGKRLDYVFVGMPDGPGPDAATWIVKDARVGMVEPHATLGCSLSDHFSVEATLSPRLRRPSPSRASHASDSAALNNGTYLQTQSPAPSIAPSDPAASHVQDDPPPHDEILALVSNYTARERRQRRLRAGHFVASFVVWLACLIGSCFTPPPTTVALFFVGSLSLAAGVVDGLMALLFFGSELRALREFEWEVSNDKHRVHGPGAPSAKDF